MKIFLTKYCSKYTMIGPIFKTDGYRFVFPIGSPLVGDISRAILNVTEGDEMKNLENKWLMDSGSRPDTNPSLSSDSLSLGSFLGLFLIAGIASFFALVIFASLFVYRQRHILLQTDSENSFWRKIGAMFKTFDQRDMSSHTFRKNEGNDSVHDTAIVMGSPSNTNFPPSPSFYLNCTGSSSPLFFRDPATPQASPQVEPTIQLVTVPNQENNSNI